MPTILLDESVPRGAMKMLSSPMLDIVYGPDIGLAGAKDAVVLQAADAFDVLVACDQSIVMQNKMQGLSFGIVVLCTNIWPMILRNRELVLSECQGVQPGEIREVLKGAHTTRYGRQPEGMDPA